MKSGEELQKSLGLTKFPNAVIQRVVNFSYPFYVITVDSRRPNKIIHKSRLRKSFVFDIGRAKSNQFITGFKYTPPLLLSGFSGRIPSKSLILRLDLSGDYFLNQSMFECSENSNGNIELIEKKVDLKSLTKFQEIDENEAQFKPPADVAKEAQEAIDWKDEYGDKVKGGTQVGWTRARQLANRDEISYDIIKRMNSFFARHKGNEKVDSDYKDEPYRDAGLIAWKIWGGDPAVAWSKEIIDQVEKQEKE